MRITTVLLVAAGVCSGAVHANAQAPAARALVAVPCPVPRSYVDEYEDFTPSLPQVYPVRVDRDHDHVIESLVTKGDEIEAPRRIVLVYLNRLRYSFSASVDVAIIQNPALPAAFTAPDLVKGIATTPAGGAGVPPGTRRGGFDGQFDDIKACVKSYADQSSSVDADQKTVTADIQSARQAYQSVLNQMPSLLSKAQAEDLRAQATRLSASGSVLRKALVHPFPADHARVVNDAIAAFAEILAEIEKGDDFKTWLKIEGNQNAYLAQKALLAQAKSTLEPLLPGKTADTTATTQQQQISTWVVRLAQFSTFKIGAPVSGPGGQPVPNVTDEDLALTVDTSCRTIFGRGKTSTVNYSAIDLFGSDSQTATKTVVATCLPVFSVTAGVGFSSLGDQTPAFVASKGDVPPGGGAAAVVQKFGYTDQSSVKPLYLVQMNGRLAGSPAGWSLHGTFGIGAVNRTDTTNVEYLTGLTIGLKSAFFMTGGLHFGRQPRIGGGFEQGDLKPADLTAVPVENGKGLRPGVAFSITFPVIR